MVLLHILLGPGHPVSTSFPGRHFPPEGSVGITSYGLYDEEEEGGWLQSWLWDEGSLREEGLEWELHSGIDCQGGNEGRVF